MQAIVEAASAPCLPALPRANRTDLLQSILFDLSLPYQGKTEQELRLAVTEACLEHFRSGGRTVLVVDEAQHLSADHLEELAGLIL